jgi:hypothetical protein
MYTPGKLIALILYVLFVILCPSTILWVITSFLGLIAILAVFVYFGGNWIDETFEGMTEWKDD